MIGNSQTQEVFDKCRRLMTGRLRRSLSLMMYQLNESLFEMAFNQGGDVTSSPYFELIRQIQFRKREFGVRFENQLSASFDQFAGAVSGRITAPDGNVEVPVCAALVQSRCAHSLLELDRRLNLLVGRPDPNVARNPMLPEVVYEAFHHACRDLDTDDEIRPLLLVLFEKHIAVQLQQIYRDANALLEREGVFADDGPAVRQLSGFNSSAAPDVRGEKITGFWIGAQIERRISNHEVPGFVRDFLFVNWRVVLESAFKRRGENSLEWKKAMQTLADLVSSVQPVRDPEQKRQILRMLPGLLFRLKTGMRSAGVSMEEQRRFLAELKEHQMNCMHGAAGDATD